MCDASTGSLSSYAYILLLLHYLQQVKPPVIPVLQQVNFDSVRICIIVCILLSLFAHVSVYHAPMYFIQSDW